MRGCRQLNQVKHLFFLTRAGEPGEPHERAELENVLLPGHRLVLLAELLSESFAALDVVRADKVACDLDAIRKIAYLHDIVI